MIQIRKIEDSTSLEAKQFIDLPFRLYKDHPYWVPPLKNDMRAVMDKENHPFYQHSRADFFLAAQDGDTLGRIAVVYNTKYNDFNDSQTAFFYYFDAVDDTEVAQILFQTASDWALKQGADTLYGPKGLLQGDGIGLLIEGFDHPPAMGIPYNAPYYQALVEDHGFQKSSDYLSGYLKTTTTLPDRVYRIAEKIKDRKDFRVKTYRRKEELLQMAPRIKAVYNAAFAGGEGFRPITEEEMQVIAQQMLSIADPRLIKLVFKGQEIVGFLFAYPNIWRGLQKANGSLWPLGWFHIWRSMRTTERVDVNGIGILPRFQGFGATAVLYVELEKTIRDFNFKHAETVQVREDNVESMGEHKMLQVNWYKNHRVYEMSL